MCCLAVRVIRPFFRYNICMCLGLAAIVLHIFLILVLDLGSFASNMHMHLHTALNPLTFIAFLLSHVFPHFSILSEDVYLGVDRSNCASQSDHKSPIIPMI